MSLNDFIGCMKLIVLLVIIPNLECDHRRGSEDKEFPWFCSVIHKGYLVSTCTIIQPSYVVVSLDSLNRQIKDSSKYFYQVIDQLEIRAGVGGSLVGEPDPKFYQVRKPSRLYAGSVSHLEIDVDLVTDPESLDDIVNDVYGVGLNVALLYFNSTFEWSSNVNPAPLPPGPAVVIHERIKNFSDRLEARPLDQQHCVVAHWMKATGGMAFTEVVYVPKQACQEAYCSFDEASCLRFPKREYLMCFKSLNYNDMCPSARGAALYCEFYKNQVLGILTTAINCGSHNLPCVYTSVEWVAKLFKKIANRDLEPGPSSGNLTFRRL